MKKSGVILVLFIIFIGCKKDDTTPQDSTSNTPDCNCDRVVKVNNFNVANSAEEGGTSVTSYIWTVNDCTNLNKNTNRNFSNASLAPKVGDCYQMPY